MKADKTKREKEFVKLDDKYVGRNYLKYLHLALEDVYYNVKSKDFKTEGLKNFHNLYVKKLLIKSS